MGYGGITSVTPANSFWHCRQAKTCASTAQHAYILGLDLPYGEPHAVVAHDGVWWSWGEPYQPFDPDWFPGAVIDEAWAVTWS